MNSLLQKLGIELPIIQAPMAGVDTPEMAAAVSNAGGLTNPAPIPCEAPVITTTLPSAFIALMTILSYLVAIVTLDELA